MTQKVIKRQTIIQTMQEALGDPTKPPISMGANITTTFPGVDPLAYVWGACRTYGAFKKDGMDAGSKGLSWASVVKASPKTLGDFESKCIEPWFTGQGWTIQ